MIKLAWSALEGADILTYKIHRSIIGFTTSAFPFGIVSGDTLKLRVNNNTLQTVTFPGTPQDINSLVIELNAQIEGATAYENSDGDKVIVRSNVRDETGYIQLFGGTALSKMGLGQKTISEKSEFLFIGSTQDNSFEDPDGTPQDFYALSTIDSQGNESALSASIQAFQFTGEICVVEGVVYDLQGRRKCDVEVLARLVVPPKNISTGYITKDEVSVLTGENGRFSLPVLQGAQIIFEIDRVQISDPVIVPDKPFVFFSELGVDTEYKIQDL